MVQGATIPLRTIPLYENSKTVLIPVGGISLPATIYFKLSAKSKLSISESNTLTKRFENHNSIKLGAAYDLDSKTFLPLFTQNSDFEAHPTELKTKVATLNESIEFVPEITVAFFGVVGPKTEIPVSANLGLNVSPTSDWDAYYKSKVDLKFGINARVFSFNIATLPLKSINFVEKELWNAPDAIEKISLDSQNGIQNQPLNNPLKVRVIDNSGLVYLEKVPVYFNVTQGGGSLSSERVLTDENGYAEVSWTLRNPGEQTVEVSVKKADGTVIKNAPVTFMAMAEEPEDRSKLSETGYSPNLLHYR